MKLGQQLRLVSLVLFTIGVMITNFFVYPLPFIHSHNLDYMALLFFLILVVILDCYPIKVDRSYISLKLMVSITVFMLFGFVAELLLTQIGYFISLFLTQRAFKLSHFFVHIMLLLMSSISALSFHIIQQVVPVQGGEVIPFVPLMAYVLASFVAHHFTVRWVRWIHFIPMSQIKWGKFKWDGLVTLYALPIALLMYIAYLSELGLYGVLIVAAPAMIIGYILNLSNHVDQANQQMEIINELTSTFTSELDLDKISNALVYAIQKLYNYDTCYIFLIDNESHKLVPMRFDATAEYNAEEMLSLKWNMDEGLSGQVFSSGKAAFINNEMGYHYSLSNIPMVLRPNKSLLSVPLKVQEKVIGVITLGSYKENGFTQKEVTLIESLAHYAATAIDNAQVFQQTERRALYDELTGLLNYRGFEQQLNEQMELMRKNESSLALLIIDIDHFKKVNDQFGHMMGNRVIQHVSRLLQKMVRKDDIVTRYGGEEFTIILPNATVASAVEIAERIRQALPAKPIRIRDDLTSGNELYIQSTVSIGVAMYPEQAEDALSLVRNADRAMYTGAKQAGRNRVAVYDAS